MTDPLADMLTRIRNALLAKKPEVILPHSNLKHNLAQLFERQGWLHRVEVTEDSPPGEAAGQFKVLKLHLKYDEQGQSAISGITRVSKPGQRIYAKVTKIPRSSLGLGETVVSTSKGLMTAQEAVKARLGGEVICQIW